MYWGAQAPSRAFRLGALCFYDRRKALVLLPSEVEIVVYDREA